MKFFFLFLTLSDLYCGVNAISLCYFELVKLVAIVIIAQNNRAKLHHTLQYSSDNKAAMNTGGL